jgi:hypothetical protein
MAKLATADHVDAIIRVLSADSWLADRAWERDKDAKDVDEVTLPDRHKPLGNGMVMIEVAPKAYVENGRPLYPTRADWEKSTGRRVTAPFSKSAFKRQSKKKVGDEVRRTFTTPDMGVEADTFEKDGRIVRIEFRVLAVPYIANKVAETRIVQGDDIPSAPPPEVVGYDVVHRGTLEALVTDTAIARMMADDEDYETPQDVRDDYDPFTLDTAVHNGFPYSRKVEDDLSRVQFDAENTEINFDAPGFHGFNTIGDLTFLGVMAGGDWESPVVFILYRHGGELRAYVPDGGNHYDRKHKRAWGNGDSDADEDAMEAADEEGWDVAALRADIAAHFGIKA